MKNLLEFIRQYLYVILFIILEIISLSAVLSSTSYKQWKTNALSKEISGPLLKKRAKIASYLHLHKENQSLQDAHRELIKQAYNIDISGRSVTDIYIDSMKNPIFEYVIANVLENSTSMRNNFLILDKGSKDSIYPGLGVLSNTGIVGIVKDVSPNFCIVMSVLNSDFSLSVINKGGDVTGVLYWDGKDYRNGIMKDVSSLNEIKKGDTLYTHHSLTFPPHYPVGRVSKITDKIEDGFYTIETEFSTHFDRISNVWIIRNKFYNELKTLKDSTITDE